MGKIGTEVFSNSEYAPGIALYGIDGTNGTSGKNGSSLFICSYAINTETGITNFGDAILQNKSMNTGSGSEISRLYINNDCFLFSDGTIWKLTDIDTLKTMAASSQFTSEDSIKKCMEQVGSIKNTVSKDDYSSTTKGNRLVLDTNNYKGFFINIADLSADGIKDTNAPMVIASNETDDDDKIQFIDIKSIVSGSDDSEFKIYYDNSNSAFHIYSSKPIIIESDLQVSDQSDVDDFDEYSKVLTSENSITSFNSISEYITYSVNDYTYTTELGKTVTKRRITLNNENKYSLPAIDNSIVNIVFYSKEDGHIEKELYKMMYGTYNINGTESVILTEYDPQEDILYDLRVSIIGNIEVSLKKK
jgi:hypothetical protein